MSATRAESDLASARATALREAVEADLAALSTPSALSEPGEHESSARAAEQAASLTEAAVPAPDETLWIASEQGQHLVIPRRHTAQAPAPVPAPAPAPAPAAVSGEVSLVLDPRGLVVSVSPNCKDVLGFEREELIGVAAKDLLHPEDLASIAPATQAFAQGLTDHIHSVQRVLHKHEGYALLETSVRSTAESEGQRPAGAVAVARVPAPKRPPVEAPAVSLTPAAIGTAYAWVMHGSRRAVIASADPVFASLMHTTTASLCGRPLEDLTDPEDPTVGQARFLTLLSGSSTTYQVERVVDADGIAAVELTVSLLPLLDKPGHMAVIQARDISRQREADRAVQNSLSELQRSNRELEAFASVAAHDLAAPLRVVVGYAEMLAQDQGQLNPQVAELLGKVASTSRRMQAQVDGLMMLARIEGEALTTSPYDMRMLADEALEPLAEDVARRAASLSIGPMPSVTCNATGIVQVFQNLIANALKYGGQAPAIAIEASRGHDSWRFTVRDRGIGIAPGEQDQLFELFERGLQRGNAPGAGIGLAVCKRIIERHGGRIWCNQRDGGGAEFHFTLPDRHPESLPARAGSATADRPAWA